MSQERERRSFFEVMSLFLYAFFIFYCCINSIINLNLDCNCHLQLKKTVEHVLFKNQSCRLLEWFSFECRKTETKTKTMIGFGLASDWLRRWREFFKPITERSKAKPIENRSILHFS